MDAVAFRRDVERKPEVLRTAAVTWSEDNPWRAVVGAEPRRIVLLGMGSSHFANQNAAARLQALGVNAVATLASSELLPQVTKADVVVAVSASGGSEETLHALDHYRGRCPVIALTNTIDSPITEQAQAIVDMRAETEEGGVACRSYQHTVALLLLLEDHLRPGILDMPGVLAKSVEACADLLSRREEWLPQARTLLGPDGTAFVAPAARLSSALQSALMVREGPRLSAVGCETGDWSHIDVYLTKTTDYRMLLFGGSRWEPQLLQWCEARGSRVVGLGPVSGRVECIRYRHDEIALTGLLAEVTVAELLAAETWGQQS